MNIAVYVPSTLKNPTLDFVVETFFPLFEQLRDHRFIIITDVSKNFGQLPQVETVIIKTQPHNPLLKRFWIERTLTGLLKKIKAEIFISADNFCSLRTLLPQCILLPAWEIIKPAYARKAQLIVTNQLAKKEIINKFKINGDKISIVYPSAGTRYTSVDAERRESTKKEYTDRKEYFLCNSSFQKQQDFIDLVKSFSYFKKRQQSNFKLLIIGAQNSSLGKNIENYKYRDDVVIVSPDSIDEKAAIIAAAYAIVLPFNTDEDISYAFRAMQSGVAVITTRESSITEIAGDAVLCSEKEIKAVAEKMMLLYKDELLRSQLIEKGITLVKNFTVEKSARQLRQSIMRAMN